MGNPSFTQHKRLGLVWGIWLWVRPLAAPYWIWWLCCRREWRNDSSMDDIFMHHDVARFCAKVFGEEISNNSFFADSNISSYIRRHPNPAQLILLNNGINGMNWVDEVDEFFMSAWMLWYDVCQIYCLLYLWIGNSLFLLLGEEGVSKFVIRIVITLLCVKILDCHFFVDLK